MTAAGVKGTGKLAKSFSYDIVETPNGAMISIRSDAKGWNNREYANSVDTGLKPGVKIPFTPIYEWVKDNKIVPKKFNSRSPQESGYKQSSYMIWKHLKENGKDAKPYLMPAAQWVLDNKTNILNVAAKDIVLDRIDKIIK
jgi:hypothetical protein